MRRDLVRGGVAVGLADPGDELVGGEGVLLRADGLDAVGGEDAADLGGLLELAVPGQRGQEAGPEGVADPGGLDGVDVLGCGQLDRVLALALDAYAVLAERGDLGADAGQDLLGRPAGLLLEDVGLVLVGEQAPSTRSRISSPSPKASCWLGSEMKV